MPLSYRDLKTLLDKTPPERLDDHISLWDPDTEECREIENAYINNEDSPTSDTLDRGHLVLVARES
jgi:hypothetical protein